MAANYIRLKLKVKPKVVDLENFWYFFDSNVLNTIESLRNDIFTKLEFFLATKGVQFTLNKLALKMFLEGYELPMFENTRLLRDKDTVLVYLEDMQELKIKTITNRSESKNSKEIGQNQKSENNKPKSADEKKINNTEYLADTAIKAKESINNKDNLQYKPPKTPSPPTTDSIPNSKATNVTVNSSFYGTKPDWDFLTEDSSIPINETSISKHSSHYSQKLPQKSSNIVNRVEQLQNEIIGYNDTHKAKIENTNRNTPMTPDITNMKQYSKRTLRDDKFNTFNHVKRNNIETNFQKNSAYTAFDDNILGKNSSPIEKPKIIRHRHSIGPDLPFNYAQSIETYENKLNQNDNSKDYNKFNNHVAKTLEKKEKVDMEPPKKKASLFSNEETPAQKKHLYSKTPDILQAGNFFASNQESFQINTKNEQLNLNLNENLSNEKERESPQKTPNNSDSSSSSRKSSITKTEQKKRNIEVCMIGSSMIAPINIRNLFPDKVCMFKCILGGLTRDCFEYIRRKKEKLKDCKCFIIVCASNDCDSFTSMNYVITEYLDFALYLHDNFPEAKLLFNKLVPRLISANVPIQEFEQRRVIFNDFIHGTLSSIIPCTIISHSKFENKERLMELLYDGVHFSDKAVPIYEKKLRKVIESISF